MAARFAIRPLKYLNFYSLVGAPGAPFVTRPMKYEHLCSPGGPFCYTSTEILPFWPLGGKPSQHIEILHKLQCFFCFNVTRLQTSDKTRFCPIQFALMTIFKLYKHIMYIYILVWTRAYTCTGYWGLEFWGFEFCGIRVSSYYHALLRVFSSILELSR